MSDQFDAEVLDAARKIAARCGALGLCDACGSTWLIDDFDIEDDDSMSELMTAARRLIEEDSALDRFDDDGGLKQALTTVIVEAEPEQSCPH